MSRKDPRSNHACARSVCATSVPCKSVRQLTSATIACGGGGGVAIASRGRQNNG